MSKQDIKEEVKDLEGNPQMKARIRRCSATACGAT
jgi:flagellar biosynthesis protein FlhB